MVICFAADCSHRSARDSCSFYRFPKDAKKHALWTRLSRRADRDPKSDSDPRLCSCHFVDGKKENGPSLFRYNEKARLSCNSPAKNRVIVSKQTSSEDKGVDDEIIKLKRENTLLKAENVQLTAENFLLKSDFEKLKQDKRKFSFQEIAANDDYVLMYTGLPNAEVFYSILSYVEKMEFEYVYGWKVEALTLEDQLFITLQKLRQNYQFSDLAVRYSVSDTLIRNVFFTLLSVLDDSLYSEVVNTDNIPSFEEEQS